MHRLVLLGDKAQMEARFGPIGAVLVSVQDRCTVCAKCSIASKIVLDALEGTTLVTWFKQKLVSVHLDTMLISIQDRCTVCAKCSIASKIIFDAPEGTTW
jgi:NAD-dependent dihydropyrimidine dehydrogenase PreA subunit